MVYNLYSIIYILDINDLIILEYLKKSDKRVIGLIKSSTRDKLIDNYNKDKIWFLGNRSIINIKIENLFPIREIQVNNRYK